MSRKTNKLKNRLRIESGRAKREARINAESRKAFVRFLKSQQSDSFAKSIMISVEKERQYRGMRGSDVYAILLRFLPGDYGRALFNHSAPGKAINIVECAERVGWEIGKMASKAIAETLLKESR